jgi:hypothetical protein
MNTNTGTCYRETLDCLVAVVGRRKEANGCKRFVVGRLVGDEVFGDSVRLRRWVAKPFKSLSQQQ